MLDDRGRRHLQPLPASSLTDADPSACRWSICRRLGLDSARPDDQAPASAGGVALVCPGSSRPERVGAAERAALPYGEAVTSSADRVDVRRRAGWFPQNQDDLESWLAGHRERVNARGQDISYD